MELYLVDAHLGHDYWIEVTDEPDQGELIEEQCETCGDSDWIIGMASDVAEAKKLVYQQYQDHELRRTMLIEAEKLFNHVH